MKNINLDNLAEAFDLIQEEDHDTDNALGDVALILIAILKNHEGQLIMNDTRLSAIENRLKTIEAALGLNV